MSIEAMKLALEALEVECRMYEATDPETGVPYNMIQAITALRQAIEQDKHCKHCTDGCLACDARKLPEQAQKQEPVAWMASDTGSVASAYEKANGYVLESAFSIPLYATPPQHQSEQAQKENTQKIGVAFKKAFEALPTTKIKEIEQAQEPVATVMPVATVISETGDESVTMSWWHEPALPVGTQLYTSPPQRTWVGLTDDEMTHTNHHMVEGAYQYSFKQGAKWAEAKLKDKNGYAEGNT